MWVTQPASVHTTQVGCALPCICCQVRRSCGVLLCLCPLFSSYTQQQAAWRTVEGCARRLCGTPCWCGRAIMRVRQVCQQAGSYVAGPSQ